MAPIDVDTGVNIGSAFPTDGLPGPTIVRLAMPISNL